MLPAIWLSYAGSRSISSGAMAQPRPVCVPGGKRQPGTTTTCSSFWRGRLFAPPSRGDARVLAPVVNGPSPRSSNHARPRRGTRDTSVRGSRPLLARAADNPVHHRSGAIQRSPPVLFSPRSHQDFHINPVYPFDRSTGDLRPHLSSVKAGLRSHNPIEISSKHRIQGLHA